MDLQKPDFEGLEGTLFLLHGEADSCLELTLTEVSSPEDSIVQHARELGLREPFSLLFRGPMEPLLAQSMYTLQHARLGPVEVFLVPINQAKNGCTYEAVFG